jgi:DNA-binding NtrC family response regulator
MYTICMNRIHKLSSQDRRFFELVSRASFCNPFSDTRLELDLRIAECSPDAPFDERLERAVGKVAEGVQRLKDAGRADLRLYQGEDRYLLQNAFLFHVFHHVSDRFDEMIRREISSGYETRALPFARDTLAMLTERGFSVPDAHRFFAMFYQVRRAFYFINVGLVGGSPSMKRLRLHLWDDIFTHDIRWYEKYLWDRMEDFSTLLLGETGTGKGTAAAAIGRSGFIPFDAQKGCFVEGFTQNFISINLSQYPEALIESELFGHRKGAFTGAIEHHQGIFARCSPHGSIFLDEIGDVSIPVQVKLLQVLQDRTFSPVGSHEKLRFNGRVIAATNKPFDELRRGGLFRDDLFYRLCSDMIVVPPLRQRLDEDPAELDTMVAHVIRRIVGEASKELTAMVRGVIGGDLGPHYAWPGNVRELEQAVRRILLTNHYLGDRGVAAPGPEAELHGGITDGLLTAHELVASYCALLYDRFGTYEEVARRTGLDRRTVKKHVQERCGAPKDA